MSYHYDVVYRPGSQNPPADTLSRHTCSILSDTSELHKLHASLCHPGITRMVHFVKVRNLPYTIEEIKAMAARCSICAELKPRFYKPANTHLTKATQPFERLSLDFKGQSSIE